MGKIKRYKGYLIDLDGTVYNGTAPIPTAGPFIAQLMENNIPHLYLTNNATRTPEEVVSYLKEVCQIETTVDHVYTSGIAAVDYLAKEHPRAHTYVIGEESLRLQAKEAGLILADKDIQVVLQALDRKVTYEKFTIASRAIQKGAAFIATNPDTNLPTEDGFIPGAGSLTAFLETSSRIKPTIIGKPYAPIMDGALKRMGMTKDEVVMVGDNYTTDILAGINGGVDTILVLTGFTQLDDLAHVQEQPTYIINDLSEWRVL